MNNDYTEKKYPLTQTQLGIYAECAKHEGEPCYNITSVMKCDKRLDAKRLADAVNQSIMAHPSFFVQIGENDEGYPEMYYRPLQEDEDLCSIVRTEDEDLRDILADLRRPFNLGKDRLIRIRIAMTPGNTYLCIGTHHIIYDGASRQAFFRSIDTAYQNGTVEKEGASIFEISAREEAARKKEGVLQGARDWYLEQFGDVEETTLPDADRNATDKVEFGQLQRMLTLKYSAFAALYKQLGVSPSVLMYGVFGRLLGAYTGKKDVTFATIWHGRHDADTTHTVNMMVKTLPVRCLYDKDTKVADYVKTLHEQVGKARENDIYSFHELCGETGVTGDVLFAYHGKYRGIPTVDDCSFEQVTFSENETGTPLALWVAIEGDNLRFKLEYQANRYSEDFITRFADSFDAVLNHIAENPDAKVSELSIVSDKQEKELQSFHQVAKGEVEMPFFHKGIERWAAKTPDAVAIIATDLQLTYREYNEAANRMARALMARGLAKGDRVVLLLPRRSHFLVALFAVMKCGAAYIPMDPAYPSDRISFILSDSDGKFVITTSEHAADYPGKAIDVDELTAESMRFDASNPIVDVTPQDLAYLIYTSGSTGRPKGVMLEHFGVGNFFQVHPANFVVLSGSVYASVVLCQTTVSFDLSIFEYGAPLFNGKTVVFANEEETINPVAQAELCKRTGVECISGTPSRIAMNLELGTYEELMRNQIKAVMTGGEKLPRALVERLKSMDVKVVNGYGPTETTMSSSSALMNDAEFVHVGKPGLNYSYRILDSDLNELPAGVMGELVIGGLSLARGYNKLPEKTAAAFIEWKGERVYRSGDYARWTSDGNVIILGRTDHQIKLNGLRIELGEIETVLAKQTGVKQCVVVIKKYAGQDKLVAYYTSSTNEKLSIEDLKRGMAEHLTHYMVPSVFMQLDTMPITPAGKIDVKHLPNPEVLAEKKILPETPLEQQLFDILKELLENDKFGVTTNLLSVGLTSLLSIRLSVILKKKLNHVVKVTDIMASPTIREIASLLEKETSGSSVVQAHVSSESTIRPNTPFPLTFAQSGVYFDCLKNPDTTIYNIPLWLHIPAGVTPRQLCDGAEKVLSLHPALFSRIVNLDDEPVMLYPKSTAPEIKTRRMKNSELERYKETAVQPFNLSKGPLFRSEVVCTETDQFLFLDTHHLVSDGSSVALICSQIADALNGKPTEKEGVSYFEFADTQRTFAESPAFLDSVEFYDNEMRHFDAAAEIPIDKPAFGPGERREIHLPIEHLRQIDDFCKAQGMTGAQFWFAVTSFVLGRYADRKEVYLTGISSGRQNLDIAGTVGMFVNTLALHAKVAEKPVGAYLREATDTFSRAMQYENYPFSQIAADYGFRSRFTYIYQLGLMTPNHAGGEEIIMEAMETNVPKFPVTVSIEHAAGVPSVVVAYDDALYLEDTVRNFAADMLKAADELTARQDSSLDDIQITLPPHVKEHHHHPVQPLKATEKQIGVEGGEESTSEAGDSEIEQTFCGIFAKILGKDKVGATENFFELGGTSLVAVKVVIEAMNAGYKIDYKTIFDNPTPRMIARTIRPASSASTKTNEASASETEASTKQMFASLLASNTLDSFRKGDRQPVGGAIVTGSTGYLALHIIKELIDRDNDTAIYCMARSKGGQSALKRMRALLFYYFDDSFDDLIGKRLFIIDGDVTNPDSFSQLPTHADGITHLYNCAANVKHFSSGTDIEDINSGGAGNCIEFCLKAGVMMVQTSTHSVSGTTVSDKPVPGHNITERELYWGQTLDNRYIHSKFEAERRVMEAVEKRGLSAKIMRLGNLSARSTDGEYQVNFSTNSFMGRLRAYQAVGAIPYENMSASIEFSPINEVARAVVLLSETPKENIVFHPVNANTQPYGNVVNCLNHLGIKIDMVEQDTFQKLLIEAASDASKQTILQSMLAYQDVSEGKYVVFNGVDYLYTTQVLMRLGFQWSFTTWDYIERFIVAIKGLGFFDEDYER